MNDFLEIDEKKKTLNTMNLEDFSVEDLNIYVLELKNEIKRVEEEFHKKRKFLEDAQKLFK